MRDVKLIFLRDETIFLSSDMPTSATLKEKKHRHGFKPMDFLVKVNLYHVKVLQKRKMRNLKKMLKKMIFSYSNIL